ncbi:MAG: hypothetical protein K0R09_1955 [Clostridiales bacterium]|nr:hypothetical protein [Clostridiales bacterium]
MMLDKNELINLINELSLLDDIKLSDIPDMNLYMEQVTTLIDDKLGHLKRVEEDKILTKTMINNYTKSGILMPPKNKKYNKQHIILLVLIYNLKQILSINDIHTLLCPILNDMETLDDDLISLSDIYSTFLEIKHNEFEDYSDIFSDKFNLIDEKISKIDSENKSKAELFLLVIMLVAQADAQKRLAEKIIDKYFKKDE